MLRSFKNHLSKFLFDLNFVCFICFWRLSDVTNLYSVLASSYSFAVKSFVLLQYWKICDCWSTLLFISEWSSQTLVFPGFHWHESGIFPKIQHSNIELSKRSPRPCIFPWSYFMMRKLCSFFCFDCPSAMNPNQKIVFLVNFSWHSVTALQGAMEWVGKVLCHHCR